MKYATRLVVAALTEMARKGYTYEQAAAETGMTYFSVGQYARKYLIPLVLKPRGKPASGPDDRSERMAAMYREGKTLVEIGAEFSVTRERVRQILTGQYGITASDGGARVRALAARKEFARKRDKRCLKKWGCNYQTYRSILKHKDQPTYAYWQQRRNAIERGIGWELTLWQWWQIWDKSGRWNERGRGHGYCMCRLNDTGPYAVDNVYIATGAENMQDHWVLRRAAQNVGVAA